MSEIPIWKASSTIPIAMELLDDYVEIDVTNFGPSVDRGPYRPPHDSHRRDSEGGECLLCDEWEMDKLAEECAFEVVPRR